jgi:hypothetical protein
MTANDRVHGPVEVRYRGNVVHNLYLSVVEIVNDSIKDLENLEIGTYRSGDQMMLMTETAFIDGSIQPVNQTRAYAERIAADAEWERQVRAAGNAEAPENTARLTTDTAFRHGQRHYFVPVLNRGQRIKITYLTTVAPGGAPIILVDCQSKGVRVGYKTQPQPAMILWGVPTVLATFIGLPIWVIVGVVVSQSMAVSWVWAVAGFVAGICVTIPGVLAVKIFRWLRARLVG